MNQAAANALASKGFGQLACSQAQDGLGTRRPFGSRVMVVSGMHEQIGCGVVLSTQVDNTTLAQLFSQPRF